MPLGRVPGRVPGRESQFEQRDVFRAYLQRLQEVYAHVVSVSLGRTVNRHSFPSWHGRC